YITVPFDWHMHYEPHDYFRMTPYGLRALLLEAGFTIEALEPVGGLFTATAGEILGDRVCDLWLPAARALGIKRGAYRVAALLSLPWNLTQTALAPLLDRTSPRSPFCTVARARREGPA